MIHQHPFSNSNLSLPIINFTVTLSNITVRRSQVEPSFTNFSSRSALHQWLLSPSCSHCESICTLKIILPFVLTSSSSDCCSTSSSSSVSSVGGLALLTSTFSTSSSDTVSSWICLAFFFFGLGSESSELDDTSLPSLLLLATHLRLV